MLPAGGKPAGSAFYVADKREKRAEKVNKLSSQLSSKFQEAVWEVKG